MQRKLKTRIHFNRVNMQRLDPRVWSVHNSHGCNMASKIVIRHKGEKILETIFNPSGKQPRAYLSTFGLVHYEGDTAVVEI